MKVKTRQKQIVIPGYRFAGVSCGIKESGKKDLALIYSETPMVAVGAFTTNRVRAAPVLIGEERLRDGQLQAIVVNSGNANASTGQAGLRVARDSCRLVAQTLKVPGPACHSFLNWQDWCSSPLGQDTQGHCRGLPLAVPRRVLGCLGRYYDHGCFSQGSTA